MIRFAVRGACFSKLVEDKNFLIIQSPIS
jgi:hypothetical protein